MCAIKDFIIKKNEKLSNELEVEVYNFSTKGKIEMEEVPQSIYGMYNTSISKFYKDLENLKGKHRYKKFDKVLKEDRKAFPGLSDSELFQLYN